MCTSGIYYFVDGEEVLTDDSIKSPGPPSYYWQFDPVIPKPIPEWID